MVQSRSVFLTVFPDAFRTHNQNRNQHVSRNIYSLSLTPLFLCMNLQCSWMLETTSCGANLLSQFVLVRPQTIEAESILHHETYVYFACLRVCDANAVCVPGSRVTSSSLFQYVHFLWFCAEFSLFSTCGEAVCFSSPFVCCQRLNIVYITKQWVRCTIHFAS